MCLHDACANEEFCHTDLKTQKMLKKSKTQIIGVELGNTKCLCGIAAELLPPSLDRPNYGMLNFLVDLSAMGEVRLKECRSSPAVSLEGIGEE